MAWTDCMEINATFYWFGIDLSHCILTRKYLSSMNEFITFYSF